MHVATTSSVRSGKQAERTMPQLKQFSNVLWQFCHRASMWALKNNLKLGFAAYITGSLFCFRRWFVELFTRESHKVAKKIQNLRNQSTDLQKMKGILNRIELLRKDHYRHPTSDIQHTHAYLSAFCAFLFWKSKLIFSLPSRTKKKKKCRCSTPMKRPLHCFTKMLKQ